MPCLQAAEGAKLEPLPEVLVRHGLADARMESTEGNNWAKAFYEEMDARTRFGSQMLQEFRPNVSPFVWDVAPWVRKSPFKWQNPNPLVGDFTFRWDKQLKHYSYTPINSWSKYSLTKEPEYQFSPSVICVCGAVYWPTQQWKEGTQAAYVCHHKDLPRAAQPVERNAEVAELAGRLIYMIRMGDAESYAKIWDYDVGDNFHYLKRTQYTPHDVMFRFHKAIDFMERELKTSIPTPDNYERFVVEGAYELRPAEFPKQFTIILHLRCGLKQCLVMQSSCSLIQGKMLVREELFVREYSPYLLRNYGKSCVVIPLTEMEKSEGLWKTTSH